MIYPGKPEKTIGPSPFKPDYKLLEKTKAHYRALNEQIRKEYLENELPMLRNDNNDKLLYRFNGLLFEKNKTGKIVYVYSVRLKRNTVVIIDEFELQCSFREECESYYIQNFYRPHKYPSSEEMARRKKEINEKIKSFRQKSE